MQFQWFTRERSEQIFELNSCKQMPLQCIFLSKLFCPQSERNTMLSSKMDGDAQGDGRYQQDISHLPTQHSQMKPSVNIWEPRLKPANRIKLLVQKRNTGAEVWTEGTSITKPRRSSASQNKAKKFCPGLKLDHN